MVERSRNMKYIIETEWYLHADFQDFHKGDWVHFDTELLKYGGTIEDISLTEMTVNIDGDEDRTITVQYDDIKRIWKENE